MTAKRITEKGVLSADMRQLMTPDAIKELSKLTPTIQQFLLRWQDKRDVMLSEELQTELKTFLLDIYERDNEQLCANVSKYVCAQVAETISPIWSRLQELRDGQKEIKETLDIINKRLDKIENTVLIVNEKRLQRLERHTSWSQTILRGVVYVVLAVILSVLLTFQLFNNKITNIERLLKDHIKIEQVK